MFPRTLTRAGFVGLMLAGCGEKKLLIDAEVVNTQIDRVDANVPLCSATDAGPSPMRALAPQLGRLPQLLAPIQAAKRFVPRGSLRTAGSCGGDFSVTWEHESGVTDYTAAFQALCLESDDGVVVLEGSLTAREIGTPSDSGPVISAFEARTDGPIAVLHDGKRMLVEIDEVRTEFGKPETWAPGFPDDANPDRTTLTEATVTWPDDGGRVEFARDVEIERTSGIPYTIHVRAGVVGTEGEGAVDVRTPDDDPVVFGLSIPFVQSGAIDLLGSKQSSVRLTANPSAAGVIDIALNGEPFDRGVDCGLARQPLLEGALILMSELPLY